MSKGKPKKKVEVVEDTSFDVFLMLKSECTVKELEEIVNEKFKELETDTWPELNIMEINLDADRLIDFVEAKNSDAFTPEDKELFNSKGIKNVYMITHEPEDLKVVVNIVKCILDKYDGMLGNDTDNFEPLFEKDNLDNFNYNE